MHPFACRAFLLHAHATAFKGRCQGLVLILRPRKFAKCRFGCHKRTSLTYLLANALYVRQSFRQSDDASHVFMLVRHH